MKSTIKVKLAFTLIELLIVIVILSLAYAFVFSNLKIFDSKEQEQLSLSRLNSYVTKNFDFENKLEVVCVDSCMECFVLADNTVQKKRLTGLFKESPEVYEYSTALNRVFYNPFFIEDTNYDVCFRYRIDSDYKSSELIVDTFTDGVYSFNSLRKEVEKFESVDEVVEKMQGYKNEVKDAL